MGGIWGQSSVWKKTHQMHRILFVHMNHSSINLSSMCSFTWFEIVRQSQTWGYSCISCFFFLLKRDLASTSSRHRLALFDVHLTTSKKDHHQQNTKDQWYDELFCFRDETMIAWYASFTWFGSGEISWNFWLSIEMYVLLLSYHKYDFHSSKILSASSWKRCHVDFDSCGWTDWHCLLARFPWNILKQPLFHGGSVTILVPTSTIFIEIFYLRS